MLAVFGFFLLGGGSTAGHQARYAGADLAPPERRSSHLSTVVCAATIGAVTGPPMAGLAERGWQGLVGGADYIGSMVALGVSSLFTAVAVAVLLRPDPLLTARRACGEDEGPRRSIAGGFRMARANGEVRTGAVGAALGHFVMVGVMSMAAIHIKGGMAEPAEALTVIGFILGLHIGAMYAFAPIIGRLADRHGARPVLVAGTAVLVAACAVAGSSAVDDHVRISVGLVLLGIGWSTMTVSAATMITGAVTPAERPSTQGFSDLVMGLSAMCAGIASGPIVEYLGYGMLNVLCAAVALVVVPFLLRTRR